MTPEQQEKHYMIVALQERHRAEWAGDSVRAGFIQEAAIDVGFVATHEGPSQVTPGATTTLYECTAEQLVEFARRAEAAGHFQYARRAGHTTQQAIEILNRFDKTKDHP